MIDLMYSLTIEATEEPDFFGFYSTELQGFSGVGHSVEDCLYKAKWGMIEHTKALAAHLGLTHPARKSARAGPGVYCVPAGCHNGKSWRIALTAHKTA